MDQHTATLENVLIAQQSFDPIDNRGQLSASHHDVGRFVDGANSESLAKHLQDRVARVAQHFCDRRCTLGGSACIQRFRRAADCVNGILFVAIRGNRDLPDINVV